MAHGTSVHNLPVVVVDEHGDCLRGVADSIPRADVLLHFDSHPDLDSPCLPRGALTKLLQERDPSYAAAYVDVATWVLPLVAAEHVGAVVWMKPPWSHQIAAGTYPLQLTADTNRIRVRPDASDKDEKAKRKRGADDRYSGCRDYWQLSGVWTEDGAGCDGAVSVPFVLVVVEDLATLSSAMERLGPRRVILDVDEDYFSCANPIRESLRLFASQEAVLDLCRVFADDVTDSRTFLAALDRYIEQGVFRIKLQQVRQRNSAGGTILEHLGVAREEALKAHLMRHADDAVYPVTEVARFADMHELPEHVATSKEVQRSMNNVMDALCFYLTNAAPSVVVEGVIIAQSVTDGYTPSPQAPFIHAAMVAQLDALFAKINKINADVTPRRREYRPRHHPHSPTRLLFQRSYPPEEWRSEALRQRPIYVTYELAAGAQVSFPEAQVMDASPVGLVPVPEAGGGREGSFTEEEEENEEEEEEEAPIIPWEAVRTWGRTPPHPHAVDRQWYDPHAAHPAPSS
eukprot:TRINITY_DN28349_c0_g1_i1.p1 TRINITY_DN28349_c0_g1~~TRINITY_DN28349_c0_g1_i1.p1  ORF type:complete len:515 (+),score=108.07 TRINITY_DN28349_c0_g1_i1:100-1644(+)